MKIQNNISDQPARQNGVILLNKTKIENNHIIAIKVAKEIRNNITR